MDQLVQLLAERTEYSSRLEFLYKIVEDTQGTIRFLDTKAAFCVTLLTALMAGAVQVAPPAGHASTLHRVLFAVLVAIIMLSLTLCLRVIFPTVHLSGTYSATGPAKPFFFLAHKNRKHWILSALSNNIPNLLVESHDHYLKELRQATDEVLMRSMCDEVISISMIRQVKSDRLHIAIFTLAAAVLAFIALLIF